MYTRCPKCEAVYRVNAGVLSHSRGLVQCGQCNRSFSSLSFLFDDWPTGKPKGPATGKDAVPPLLAKQSKKPEPIDEAVAESHAELLNAKQQNHKGWVLAATIMLVLTVANAGWAFRQQIVQNTPLGALFEKDDAPQVEIGGLPRIPDQIQLVSRDMHTHPTRTGILVLSLTFVNLAQSAQAYPEMEITLLDATNQQVAKRLFKPSDYLRAGFDTSSGLAKDVYLPVLLELGDPGEQAVGFEISFF
jgi:predicted Zn finger-like uncharacterized protein